MTKKKILVLALSLAMVAILAVGGSLAYFTSDDHAENTFTAGGVKIDLIEQQVNEAGDDLEDFKQGQTLFPIVGSAQGEKDEFGQPIAENYIDKIVTIKNTGKSAAWVRAYFAIPSALDDGYETFNAGANILHFNFGNKIDEDGITSTYGNEWNWMHGSKWNYFETTIDGIKYNVYFADYEQVLPAGDTTEQFISGVYLDENVDMKDGKYTDKRFPNADLSILEGTVKCPVYAVAVQAAGFDNAADAITAAFGENYNPWGTPASNWQ
jgi:predicted ribosomally synthesized peptide with SipW-like signal peptide